MRRRLFLGAGVTSVALAAAAIGGLLSPCRVLANWPESAFDARSVGDAMTALFGSCESSHSVHLRIKTRERWDSGSSVPITVLTDGLENLESLNLFAEKNPVPLLANFEMTGAVATPLTTRIKLAETSYVIAIARANGRLYSTRKKVEVLVGGCP